MITITLQIGNSDDKLSQVDWSGFYWEIAGAILDARGQMHFSGAAPGSEPWQNACWVFVIDQAAKNCLRERVAAIRAKYRQDSVAWTEGETAFV